VRVAVLVVGVLASIVVLPSVARAQDEAPMTAADAAEACAPPATKTGAPHALRIVGAQDTVPRALFGPGDLLVINGGTDAGVALGSEFYVRRTSGTGAVYGMPADSDVITDGWIKVVAVNGSTSIAGVERACGPIFANDYLEPFTPPHAAAAAEGPIDPDFSALARVVSGADGHTVAAINEFTIIDRGSQDGVQPGARFAIYRDLTANRDPLLAAPAGTPLTSIGEAVVVTTTGNRAVARIVRARDAVLTGDYAAPHKP